jgi:hypothetical protein
MNHAYTHKCSGYCAIWKELHQKYNPDIHILLGEYLKKIDDKNVVVISYECQMGFGELLKYEIDSGENNKTCGKDPLQRTASIEMDKNGQPRFVGK